MIGMPTILEFKTVEENIAFAKEYGFDFIELNLNFSYVRKFIENNSYVDDKLKYTLHFFDEADFGLYNEVSDAYILLLDKYLYLGKNYISQVNVHLNVGPIVTISGIKHYLYKEEFDEYIKRLIFNLSKVKTTCDKYHINLVLENIDSLDFILDTYKYLENKFYFCYDIGHDKTSTGLLKNYFDYNKDKFNEVHFHDSTKTKCHLAFSEGDLPIKEIYRNIKDIEYILIEVKSKQDLIKSIQYLNECK